MTRVVQQSDRPWLPLDGDGENFMKIIAVDGERKQVVLMVKFGPNAVYPQHIHKATAVAYTVAGEWEYEEGVLSEGAWALEPPGTDHTPVVSSKGATILAILTSDTDEFVEVPLPGGGVLKQDLAYFQHLYSLTAEQAAEQHAVGVSMTTRESA